MARGGAGADDRVREERPSRKVVAMRRLLVLALVPWMLLTFVGVSRASAATDYPGPTPPSTAGVLGATQTNTATHGTTQSGTSLPFTGGDVAMLLGFAAAVLVPGVGLLVVSRRRSRGGLRHV
jgi:hypothetical protein